jgi:murein DD-endopeptidase MepM/ murein hydrolase activator NlpD
MPHPQGRQDRTGRQEKQVNQERTRFTETLIQANGLDPDRFRAWVFCRGMGFNSPHKWWGDHGRRDFPHEGIDFCLYQDAEGQIRRLPAGTRIPVMHDGVVRALFTDYLGRAVILEHEPGAGEAGPLLSVYAHTRPLAGIAPGVTVAAGEVIATIADTGHAKANILAHLHYSIGRPAPDLVYQPFVWNIMRDPDRVTLLDPLAVVDWPCREKGRSNRTCLGL